MAHVRALPASSSRVRLAPDARRAQIVAAARTIFVHQGHAALSLRAVAAACDVRLSTVQHHFSGRPALIDAMVGAIIDECLTIYGRYRDDPSLAPEARLRATLSLLFAQNEDAETALLFPELWSLAEREPVASDATDRLYVAGRDLLAGLIGAVHPAAAAGAPEHAARLVMALADGLLISSGTRCGRSRSTLSERARFVEAAMALAAWAIACGPAPHTPDAAGG